MLPRDTGAADDKSAKHPAILKISAFSRASFVTGPVFFAKSGDAGAQPDPRRRTIFQRMSHASPIAVVAMLLFAIGTLLPLTAMAQTKPAFTVTSIAEKKIAHLPAGPLCWRIESFPTLARAKAAEAPTSLAVEAAGTTWLFTLGTPGGSTPGGAAAAEIGPLSPPADAAEYLLRVNYVRGPPGAATAVHTHPGFETFYVLSGGLSQKTSTGVLRVEAGRWSTGAAPGTAMQVASSGATDLSALVMFVLDAAKPFSTPTKFK